MPKHWHSLKAIRDKEDDTEAQLERNEFLRKICVDRKPYFFIYNYDHLYTRYRKFLTTQENSCFREFGMSFQELVDKPDKTPEQEVFLSYCEKYNPVDSSPCVVNKMCWLIERQTSGFKVESKGEDSFDPALLKSPSPEYSAYQYYEARKFLQNEYESYKANLRRLMTQLAKEGVHGQEKGRILEDFNQSFITRAKIICPSEELKTDVLIDIAYKSNDSKKFVWELCSKQIIRNLLKRKDNKFMYPVRTWIADDDNFTFHGETYRLAEYTVPEMEMEESFE